jgi:NDP-sugar pyrophosphorylase family protein
MMNTFDFGYGSEEVRLVVGRQGPGAWAGNGLLVAGELAQFSSPMRSGNLRSTSEPIAIHADVAFGDAIQPNVVSPEAISESASRKDLRRTQDRYRVAAEENVTIRRSRLQECAVGAGSTIENLIAGPSLSVGVGCMISNRGDALSVVRHGQDILPRYDGRIVIGDNVRVTDARIGYDVQIGNNVDIQRGAVIRDNARIGGRSRIEAGAMIGVHAVIGARSHIGARAEIGPYVVVGEGASIGSGAKIGSDVGDRAIIEDGASIQAPICAGARVAARACIVPGVVWFTMRWSGQWFTVIVDEKVRYASWRCAGELDAPAARESEQNDSLEAAVWAELARRGYA